MTAGKRRLGAVEKAGADAVDHAASAPRTRQRVVSGGGEIGRQATALGCGAACHRVLGAGSAVAVELSTPQRCGHGDDSRVGSTMDAGAAAIQEESDGDFYFEQREVGASVRWMCWAVQAGGGPPTRVRTKRTPYPQYFQKKKRRRRVA
jgi:hypothetical protein